MNDFSDKDYWKALVLYGLNQATYKIALGKTLLELCAQGQTKVPWETLSRVFFQHYQQRLSAGEAMPQQSIPSRQTKMEQIVNAHNTGRLDYGQAVSEVGSTAFGDVIHRFHNLGSNEAFQGMFYRFDFGKQLELTDELLSIAESGRAELDTELDARWGLLEGAFSLRQENYSLANDLRLIYIENGHKRKTITGNIPFLQGYQGNACFYCGEEIGPSDTHVDHVLPRQVVQHDEIWNLVLAHSFCNEHKSDQLVGKHFIEKLMARNENIIGSNHPWKKKIIAALGKTPAARGRALEQHYDRVKSILGANYWCGLPSYNPETDRFYSRLITVLNNGGAR